VRVRLTRIDPEDLNLFEFDYDLTFIVFFLDAQENVYARYGGRDAAGSDKRLSLEGLEYTMKAVLAMHQGEEKRFAPKAQKTPRHLGDMVRIPPGNRCLHCHQVKQVLDAVEQRGGKWSRDSVWRYPPPANLGLDVEIDRGNVVKTITERSAAAQAGLQPGDLLQALNGVPIHSFGDAQLALDRAPATGTIEVAWQRDGESLKASIVLPKGWRQTDISWRASMRNLIPAARLYGDDLTTDKKKALGLGPKQLAFRQRDSLPAQARDAGIRPGDVIVGMDNRTLEMDVNGFLGYVRRHYLVGDKVTVNLYRDGRRMDVLMTLSR
jgi:serine protease Do